MKLNEATRSYRFLVLYAAVAVAGAILAVAHQNYAICIVLVGAGIVLGCAASRVRMKFPPGTSMWFLHASPRESDFQRDLALVAAQWSGPISSHEHTALRPGENVIWLLMVNELKQELHV